MITIYYSWQVSSNYNSRDINYNHRSFTTGQVLPIEFGTLKAVLDPY